MRLGRAPRSSLAVAGITVLMVGAATVARGQQGAGASTGAGDSNPYKPPIMFYLAKGEPDACGPGCSEWIAADGRFEPSAADRLQLLLLGLGARKLPIFFHSPGGQGASAVAIGRILRARGMTAGVSRTTLADCVGKSEDACQALKRSGKVLSAELSPLSICASACVFALIGAKVRQVPPGGRVGVHSGRVELSRPDYMPHVPEDQVRARAAEFEAQLPGYFKEMKIDVGLFNLGQTIPNEQIRFLNRNEIARFGVDASDFRETRWMAQPNGAQKTSFLKLLVKATNDKPRAFRLSALRVECAQTVNGPRILFARTGGSDAAGTMTLNIGDGDAKMTSLGSVKPTGWADGDGPVSLWSVNQSFEFLEAASARGSIDVVETNSKGAKYVIKASTAGLAQVIPVLREKCVGTPITAAPGTANTSGAASVPYLDLQRQGQGR
jgi:hypothetical protein